MTSILWVPVGFLTGILVFIAAPLVVPQRYGGRLADAYFKLSALAFGRILLHRSEFAGYDLVSSSPNGEFGTETTTIHGERKHYRDVAGCMSWFKSVPFAIADSATDTLTDPLLCHLAKESRELDEDDTGIPVGERETVEPGFWERLVPGDADASFAETTDVFVEKSQAGFKTPSTIEVMLILMALCAGFGIVVIAFKFGGASGGGFTRHINMQLTTMGWFA